MKETNQEGKGIATGLAGGILWGLDTVLIGVVLSKLPISNAFLFAPLVVTFLHDFFSSLWMLLFTAYRGGLKKLGHALTTKSGRVVMIAALFGGPVGMTGYMLAIQYIGSSNTAIISAMYPAVGALLGYLFLHEKMGKKGFIGLILAIVATMILGFTTTESPKNIVLGMLFALLCVIGWGCESVISAYGMKEDLEPEIALQIRQLVSAIVYGLAIMPLIKGYAFLGGNINGKVLILVVLTALAGTASYLCYYRSINDIGAIKAMGLNISYSAWAVFIGVFFGGSFQVKSFILALVIVAGSLLTTERPSEFFQLFYPQRSKEK